MKIQKGIVKYKDRDDIVCTYGVTDNGKTYYFIDYDDGKKLSNGNIISSTELVEAVDPMFKAKRVGVIDVSGKEIIPFMHRAIRPVVGDILLAEVAQPVTPSVIEANQMRNDPALATKLVSTPAAVKEKMNAKMGSEGRYLFNDQFSEATIYDVNGNNLVNGDYFSFIGMAGNNLYFSKSAPDAEILEYPIPGVQAEAAPVNTEVAPVTPEVSVEAQAPATEVAPIAPSTDAVNAVQTEVASPAVPAEAPVVPEAPVEAQAEAPAIEVAPIAPSAEAVGEVQTEAAPVAAAPEVPSDVAVNPVEQLQNVFSINPENYAKQQAEEQAKAEEEKANTLNIVNPEEPVQNTEAPVEVPEAAPEAVEGEAVQNVEEATTETSEISPEAVADEVSSFTTDEVGDAIEVPFSSNVEDGIVDEIPFEEENDVHETPDADIDEADDEDVDSDDLVEGTDLDDLVRFTEPEDDRFKDSEIKTDTIEYDDFDDEYNKSYIEEQDSIIDDVAKSMVGLMKQNKDLKNELNVAKDKIERVSSSRKNLADKATMQEKKIEVLTSKIRSLESTIAKLEAKNQSLESRGREQEKVIQSQSRELSVLRPQLQGKDGLVQLLADAQVLLGDEGSYSYDDDSYYKKVA